MKQKVWRCRWSRVACSLLLSILAGACASKTPTNPGAPRSNEPPYPVLMSEEPERRAATLTAWSTFASQQGLNNPPPPELQPVTATIRSLPPSLGTPLLLPKVGGEPAMNEDETRDSLRRFITSISDLIGADPQQLSLVQREDLADGTHKARYEQRPFSYPLRGNYGALEITFTSDRRVTQMTSTCIPEIDQLRRSGAGTRPRITADQVPALMAGKTFTYTDDAGNKQTFTVAKDEPITVRELVVYPIPRATDADVIEFHLTWEVAIGRESNQRMVYLDAVEENTIVAIK